MGQLTRAFLFFALAPATAATAQMPASIRPYTTCQFSDGLTLSELTPLPSGVAGRSVDTLTGKKQVALAGGEHFMLGYPGTDYLANVKIEQLPAASFAQGKADLISNFEHILAGGDDSARNYALKPTLNGFEIYGMDRKALEGNVLGIYMLIDNRAHLVTSIIFLNGDPARRKFANGNEYAALRDRFLNTYTACVHPTSGGAAAIKAPVNAAAPVAKSKAAPKSQGASKSKTKAHGKSVAKTKVKKKRAA